MYCRKLLIPKLYIDLNANNKFNIEDYLPLRLPTIASIDREVGSTKCIFYPVTYKGAMCTAAGLEVLYFGQDSSMLYCRKLFKTKIK